MRRIAAAVLGAVALVGSLAAPASADDFTSWRVFRQLHLTPQAAQRLTSDVGISTPAIWRWSAGSLKRADLVNKVTGGDVCVGISSNCGPAEA
ncbi:hypothetical protein CTZ27_12030 [Streptomyces griseocarneus]|nr:hypothetical protein CTZ27_12030 [Streptomyces griseocarneus]